MISNDSVILIFIAYNLLYKVCQNAFLIINLTLMCHRWVGTSVKYALNFKNECELRFFEEIKIIFF